MREQRFYVTTPIYYPSDKLHIGHAYTTTIADSLARFHKFLGKDVFFLTGSDEHGQKVERIAKSQGVTPKEYVDTIVASFKELWIALNIQYDDFVRTTEPRHHRAVQEVFKRIYDQGDIYLSKYEGWYCTPCETFWVEHKLLDKHCPDCSRPVELVEEESYFFRLGKYAKKLLDHIETHPEFIQPISRKNEMVNFIKSGLEDLCVSRTTFDWGVPLPFDSKHVVYVWFDALTNYLTAVGFPDDEERMRTWWPAELHLVGKEITRFHTIIWPIILMALELELPKTVFAHGWLLFDSDKMSKSKGNVVDPHVLIARYGVDAIRYFLLREISFGQDGSFSERALVERTNADLANDLGNLLHRTLAMLMKYHKGIVPTPGDTSDLDLEFVAFAKKIPALVLQQGEALKINEALEIIWQLIGKANKYVDSAAPWALAKEEETKSRLGTVMYNLLETLRIVALLVKSFLPETGGRIWEQLGIKESIEQMSFSATEFGLLQPGTLTQKGEPIFPRLEGIPEDEAPKEEEKPAKAEKIEGVLVGIEDFAKLELVVGQIKEAIPVKGADKLLKLQVDVGTETRQVVAGIAKHYAPLELVGMNVVVVKNLKPVKLRGELSQGMLLAASFDDSLELVSLKRATPGSRVK